MEGIGGGNREVGEREGDEERKGGGERERSIDIEEKGNLSNADNVT